MKINIIPTIIMLIISALLASLFYLLSDAGQDMLKALAASAFVTIGFSLVCGFGISFKDSHHTANTVATSLFFCFLFIVEHCCFAIWGTSRAWLLVTSGLMLAIYLLIYYGISKTKM